MNDAYLLAPLAEVLYFADYRWWEWHRGRPEFKAFAGQKVTIQNTGGLVADPGIFMLRNYGVEGLSEKADGVNTGSNGGYQAVNIAVLAGARRILLLGYDMRFPGGKSHWHAGHPTKVPEVHYSNYAKTYATMLPALRRLGVEVVNCSVGSAIKAFPVVPLERALA